MYSDTEKQEVLDAFYPNGADRIFGAVRNFSDEDSLDTVIVTHGRIVTEAMKACAMLCEEGHSAGIILLEILKPYGETANLVRSLLPKTPCHILFLEEEIRSGGMGMHLADELCRAHGFSSSSMKILAVDDSFVEKRAVGQSVYDAAGLSAPHICRAIKEISLPAN